MNSAATSTAATAAATNRRKPWSNTRNVRPPRCGGDS